MYHWNETGWAAAEAERAFGKAVRARRRSSLLRRSKQLSVVDAHGPRRSAVKLGVREIPLEAITGTLEPGRAAQFDGEFRPAPRTRSRWVSVWIAMHGGTTLPPIAVTPVGDGFAIRDGHHRVSVARALGAPTIAAIVV
jgi:hypothetical protein